MKQVVILGAGPAACFLALSLARCGVSPLIIGKPLNRTAFEGLSARVIETLRQFECNSALLSLGPRWIRVSSWNGNEVEMNGEFVVERMMFDSVLLEDVRAAGITVNEGLVRRVKRDRKGVWCIDWTQMSGPLRQTSADFVVECRGRTAPKAMADVHRERTLVSLGRSFEGAIAQPRTTFVESFPHGWAWGAVDAAGQAHIQTVVLPQMVRAHGGDLDATHATCMKHLHRLLGRFGGKLRAVGDTRLRGIKPVLRGGIAEVDFLRIGDAAYTCDPLSGHGVFEAVSGAIVAAPVINTLLNRPEHAALAIRFLTERTSSRFLSHLQTARVHYAQETRWHDTEFWVRARTGEVDTQKSQFGHTPSFTLRPVVENGFIVERRVVVTDEYPGGVRFIDGVDLGRLDECVRAFPSRKLTELSRDFDVPDESVHRALHWLKVQRLAPAMVSHPPIAIGDASPNVPGALTQQSLI